MVMHLNSRVNAVALSLFFSCSSSFLFDRSLNWRLATNLNTNCSFLADLKY